MFLGGAYLADVMLYCRHRIYPLGLPNGVSHVLAAILGLFAMIFGIGGGRLPPKPEPMTVSPVRQGGFKGKFSLLLVTTLEKLQIGRAACWERVRQYVEISGGDVLLTKTKTDKQR